MITNPLQMAKSTPKEVRKWIPILLAQSNASPDVWSCPRGGTLRIVKLSLGMAGWAMLRSPRQLIVPATLAPAAPEIAKSKPAPTLSPPVVDMVRKLPSEVALPSLVFPKPDKVVPRDRLEFKWKPVPRSRYYEVHVVTPEGDPVWEAQSQTAFLKVPSNVGLTDGSYFVWISAYSDDGRVQKSSVIRFQVTGPR